MKNILCVMVLLCASITAMADYQTIVYKDIEGKTHVYYSNEGFEIGRRSKDAKWYIFDLALRHYVYTSDDKITIVLWEVVKENNEK